MSQPTLSLAESIGSCTMQYASHCPPHLQCGECSRMDETTTHSSNATMSCVLFVMCFVQPPCCHATAQQRSHHASGHWARACAIKEKRMLLCVFDEKRKLLDLVFVVLLECCLCVCCLLALPCYDATGFLGRSCLQQNRPCASHDTCLLPPSFLGKMSPGSSQRGRLPNSQVGPVGPAG